jgi:hypothetical protein
MPSSKLIAPRFTAAALALAAAVTLAARPTPVAARPAKPAATTPATHKAPTPSDRWLKGVTGKHRQLFDSPAPAGGIPLVHILNYYETLNKAYGVKDGDIDGVGTFYGATTFYGLNDAMWAKYRLGEFLETNDPATGKPAVANPWRTSPVVLGMTLPQASVESLQKRGATFILCNNALQIFSGLLAQKRGLDAAAVYADLAENILPGVELVPGMVVAIEKAHDAGLSYHRQ